ncbi:hypothetical protein [Leifsonia aquatica]|uniref:hypothetical protein n=1 Tax=Leifsonia aquatica TaxID=144185 RepID=UPI0004692A13|nr:hypothetical protein [Leifsonia aquatica]
MTNVLTGPRSVPEQSTTVRARRRAGGEISALRWIVGALLVAAGFTILVSEHALRVVETQLATSVAGATYATDTVYATIGLDPVVGFTMGHGWFAAQTTAWCGSAYFVGGVLLVAGASVLVGRTSWARALAFGGTGALVLVIVGQLRLMLAALAMGMSAQPGAHTLDHPIGVAAMVASTLGVLLVILFARGPARPRA